MSTAALPPVSISKSKSRPPKKSGEKDKEKEKEKDASKEENLKLKSVVRRLPPNLPEEVFWQSVQTWVTEESVSWKVFYPGKLGKRWVCFDYLVLSARLNEVTISLNKENIPSRAYIAFKSEEQLAQFSQGYDGHLFRDKAGAFRPFHLI